MAGHVAVVTDSTAYLPSAVLEELSITVAPLHVVLAGSSRTEGVDVSVAEVVTAFEADQSVTTSRPAPSAFVDLYRRLQAEGAQAVVSVHLSGDMSGTVDSARLAAAEVAESGLIVDVVDSRSLGMGLGFGVIAAAQAAAAGVPVQEVAHIAARRSLNSSIYLYVDSLEYLRRGGRIGPARAWLGSALTIKPLLYLADGRLEALDRVRTTERAIARLVDVAVADARRAPVEIAVHHMAAAQRAEDVAGQLRWRLPEISDITVTEVGAVLGAHVGPGTVGVVVSPILPD
jgi:DegV family protein with EDD domain